MPKVPIDYSKTIMYKLVCNDLKIKECYVGHTTEMTKRKCTHKSSCNNEKDKEHNHKKYVYIRDNGGWDNWSMVMIEEYSCKNKQEATKRERELYEELQSTLNMYKPYRSLEEKKEYSKKNGKEYRENNKEYHKERSKKYRENNKEKWSDVYRKTELIKRKNDKECCEYCNKEMRKDCIKRHQKSWCPNRLVID
tara:strand:+ start:894 stop:1475 length:582 start_codon:yes stop_codon:yes gene_type:complete